MSYTYKVQNNLRFYCNDTLISTNKIPNNVYLEALQYYRKFSYVMTYFSTLPNEIREMLLYNVDLETLQLLTNNKLFSEFEFINNTKFWENLLLMDVCRNIPENCQCPKNTYLNVMSEMTEIFVKKYRCENMTLKISSMFFTLLGRDFILHPSYELLIEKILVLYPELWRKALLLDCIREYTTVTFVENFLALNPNKDLNITSLLEECLIESLRVNNINLARHLHNKGISLDASYIIDDLFVLDDRSQEYHDLLMASDKNWRKNATSAIYNLYKNCNRTTTVNLIKYYLSLGINSKDIHCGKEIEQFLKNF